MADDDVFDGESEGGDRFSLGGVTKGIRVLALICNTPVCKNSLLLLKNMLTSKNCVELTLCYVATSPYAFEGMNGVLDTMAEAFSGFYVRTEIFSKNEDQTLAEAITEFAEAHAPDLVVMGSTNLCNDSRAEEASAKAKSSNAYSAVPQSLLRSASRPSKQAFAVKLCQVMRSVPVLVVKANSKGALFSYVGASPPMKVMIDLQPTSRHMLQWMMNMMDVTKDTLYLAVTKAYDAAGVTKQTAVRMITSFSVQASVNKYKPVRKLYKDAEKALATASVEDEIDVLMIQAPRSRDLSPYVINVLCGAATSILIFPPDAENTALGQRPAPSDDGGSRPSSSAMGTRRNTSVSHDGTSDYQYRSRPGTSSGYSYHGDGNLGQMDSTTKAAMDALAERMNRRKLTEDRAQTVASNAQRGRPGAL